MGVALVGGFDLLHIGHLAALDAAIATADDLGGELTVYVVSDEVLADSGHPPLGDQAERLELVAALRGVRRAAGCDSPSDLDAETVLVTDELSGTWQARADRVLVTAGASRSRLVGRSPEEISA